MAQPLRILFLILIGTILSSKCLLGAPSQSTPNIVIMLADDAGYSDTSCYGSQHIKTPNIDSLAAQGMRFTDFYAPAPNCSPSRAGLLTGRFPTRIGIYSYINHGSPMQLPEKEITIAELLKDAGYQTCVSGKWHLNGDIADASLPSPADHGFDYWFCTDNNALPSHKNPTNFFRNGEAVGQLEGYSCQIITDEAINWLNKRDNTRPFFLYLTFHEPHTPIASPPELVAKHHGTKAEKEYYANVENMDLAVGKMLDYLDKNKLADTTLVIFASDNGGTNPRSNAPLRGRKSNVWDGGIREPGIIRWPGHITPGRVNTTPASLIDILPTLADITAQPLPADRPIDGVSLLPLFRDETIQRTTPLFWYFYRVSPSAAMRDGDWMLIAYLEKPDYSFTHAYTHRDTAYIKNSRMEHFELYNLREDVDQSHDLASQHPEKVESMKKKMTALHQDVVSDGPSWNFPSSP
jgi:arylsulfatase A